MDTKATWKDWAARLVSAAMVLALGYFALFVDFSSQGRIWDKLAARVPALAKTIPPTAGSQATKVFKTMVEPENFGDRTLLVNEKAPAQAPAAAQPAAVPVPVPVPAPAVSQTQPQTQDAKKLAAPRLTTSLTPYDIHGNSRSRVISVPETQAGADDAAQAPKAPAAAETAAAPGEASRSAVAAKTSYGAATRSEMMGQAAGPVYNIKGKSKKR